MSRFGWYRRTYKVATIGETLTGPPVMKDRRGWVNDGTVAVYRGGPGYWKLDHLPSGFGLPGYFETRENAMRAAETISGQIKSFAKPQPGKRACREAAGILASFTEFHPVFDPLAS